MSSINEDIDYDFLEKMKGFPALFKKNIGQYSNRDIIQNSWEGLSKAMGDIAVNAAKDWWNHLLAKYKYEKNQRHAEERSGSAAPGKRERFHLYDKMRDMLAFSQNSRPSITNYRPVDIQDHRPQSKPNADFYQYQSASGRGRRKQIDIANTIRELEQTIQNVQHAKSTHNQNSSKSSNADIGRMIQMELDNMSKEEADKKCV